MINVISMIIAFYFIIRMYISISASKAVFDTYPWLLSPTDKYRNKQLNNLGTIVTNNYKKLRWWQLWQKWNLYITRRNLQKEIITIEKKFKILQPARFVYIEPKLIIQQPILPITFNLPNGRARLYNRLAKPDSQRFIFEKSYINQFFLVNWIIVNSKLSTRQFFTILDNRYKDQCNLISAHHVYFRKPLTLSIIERQRRKTLQNIAIEIPIHQQVWYLYLTHYNELSPWFKGRLSIYVEKFMDEFFLDTHFLEYDIQKRNIQLYKFLIINYFEKNKTINTEPLDYSQLTGLDFQFLYCIIRGFDITKYLEINDISDYINEYYLRNKSN